MNNHRTRRNFLGLVGTAPLALSLLPLTGATAAENGAVSGALESHLRLSLNCYSFNVPLREGRMNLFDVLRWCAENNVDGIDPTGYYFPGYPEVPDNEYIARFRREAFLMGIDITGTGVRNDFTQTDPARRKADVELVKKWLEVAARLSAPTLRIFAGTTAHEGYKREEVFKWMAENVRECVEYGKKLGVVVAIQNHNDFLKTADDVLEIFRLTDHDWLGLNLDIGSYRNDPYEEIKKSIHLAVTWQIKENVWVNGQEQKTDYGRLFSIIRESRYRGYLPLETLGEGDPYVKLAGMLSLVRKAL